MSGVPQVFMLMRVGLHGQGSRVGMIRERESGATDGTRTRDNLNHNQGLYLLSYGHHLLRKIYDPPPAIQVERPEPRFKKLFTSGLLSIT